MSHNAPQRWYRLPIMPFDVSVYHLFGFLYRVYCIVYLLYGLEFIVCIYRMYWFVYYFIPCLKNEKTVRNQSSSHDQQLKMAALMRTERHLKKKILLLQIKWALSVSSLWLVHISLSCKLLNQQMEFSRHFSTLQNRVCPTKAFSISPNF